VTFDYERRQIYLEPGKRYSDRDHLTRAGALLTRREGRVGVESVLANSPADHAGLRAGDQVLAVDGRGIAEWDLPELSALFDEGEPGRKVPVRVLRGGQEKQLKMKLAEVVR
jgi:carboxyl-terminal processing protease